ncbi:Glutamine--tRNA ligase [Candidatus Hepatincolaceae symbiont of Richtersius coronifer]
MTIKVRFAPSPTGYLHLGNARMAVLNYLLALSLKGAYLLRIDDTDFKRVKPEYIEGVKEDLAWLGIKWQEEFKQSDRLDVYNQFLENLKANQRVYACYESNEELEYKRKLQLAKGHPPIYDRSMLNITAKQKLDYEKEGRRPYFRLKLEHTEIKWQDLIKGEISFKGENISDPIVVREDGSFLYILTSVIDDVEKQITHIIRGEDHVVNTAIQIQMFKFLKAALPVFAHLPLITSSDGEGFSKRDGSLSLRSLRQQGMIPLAIANYLFSVGLGERNKIYQNLEEISQDFLLSNYNTATTKFDEGKLLKINLHLLQGLPFDDIQNKAKSLLKLDINEKFWQLIKNNITKFADIKDWYIACYGDLSKLASLSTNAEINSNLLHIALQTFPHNPWDENTWNIWVDKIKLQTPLKGKELFKPLRKAISGNDDGPELKFLILLIGPEKIKQRLEQACS